MHKDFVICCLSVFMFINNCHGQHYELLRSTNVAVEKLRIAVDKFSYEIVMRTLSHDPETNLVMSPYSIWSVLTILGEGAKGNTLTELNKVLRLPDRNIVRRGCIEIGKALFVNTPAVDFKTINGIFYDSSITLREDFKKTAINTYNATVMFFDFEKPAPFKNVNKKVERESGGKIKEVISPQDLVNARIILTNSVYFRGQWKLPFNNTMTKTEQFFDSHNRPIGVVKMMHSKANFTYVNMKQFQCSIVKLPYGQRSKLAMYVILPHFNVTLNTVAANFAHTRPDVLYEAMRVADEYYGEDDIDLYLPRFKITRNVELNDLLKSMGLGDVFSPARADLGDLTEENDLFLSRVVHKACIEVTEDGTVATALSTATLADRNTPPKVKVNKPFFYFIAEESTHVIVIAGSYTKPELF